MSSFFFAPQDRFAIVPAPRRDPIARKIWLGASPVSVYFSSSRGTLSFPGGKPEVVDGPFAEAKEVIGGYWMIQVKSKEEAIEWATRCPASSDEVIEIRQVQEMSDFPDDVRQAADGLTEMQRHSGSEKAP